MIAGAILVLAAAVLLHPGLGDPHDWRALNRAVGFAVAPALVGALLLGWGIVDELRGRRD